MRLLTPLTGVSRPLHLFLILELPILIVTLALFAWGIDALRVALKFQQRAGNWDSADGDSGYGFELGTQLVSRVRTYTGSSALRTVVPSTRTLSYQSQVTEYPTERTTTTGYTYGTFTTTIRYSIFPNYYGTAFYSDVYASEGVQPSELPQATPTRASLAKREPVATAAPIQRRDASWAEGATFESTHDGLYDIYDDAPGDYKLWIGLLAGCLAVIALRILVTIGYLITAALDKSNSPKKSLTLLNVILAFANIAWCSLCGLGVAAFVYIGLRQGLGESSVQATLAFYILSALSSLAVLFIASWNAKRVKRSMRQDQHVAGNSVKNVESSSSVGQHAA